MILAYVAEPPNRSGSRFEIAVSSRASASGRDAGRQPPDQHIAEPTRHDPSGGSSLEIHSSAPSFGNLNSGPITPMTVRLPPADVVRPPDHGRVAAEPRRPQPVAHDRDALLVLGHRQAAEHRLRAERRKERGRRPRHADAFDAVAGAQRGGELVVGRDVLEQLRLLLYCEVELGREPNSPGNPEPGAAPPMWTSRSACA